MKKLEIDITTKDSLYEKYNKKKVSQDLIDYIIENTKVLPRKEEIKIIINNKTEKECKNLIKEGLEDEYKKSMRLYHKNNKTQLNYFLLGVIILFISTQMNIEIIKEMLLIGGWVFIWSMIEIELFKDIRGKRKRRLLKKIINSKIIENKI